MALTGPIEYLVYDEQQIHTHFGNIGFIYLFFHGDIVKWGGSKNWSTEPIRSRYLMSPP